MPFNASTVFSLDGEPVEKVEALKAKAVEVLAGHGIRGYKFAKHKGYIRIRYYAPLNKYIPKLTDELRATWEEWKREASG